MSGTRSWLARVDADRMRAGVFYLARDPLPRRTLNYTRPGQPECTLYEADDWIAGQLTACGYTVAREEYPVRAFGCDETKPIHHWYAEPPPDAPTYAARNLIAELRGQTTPEEILVLLAHKDSQSWIDCPGALDNAVGAVAVLEIARILAARGTRRTVRFLFCNEEHTPWTSVFAAQAMRDRGDRLAAVVNVDSLAGKSDEDLRLGRKTNVTLYTRPEGKPFADLMERVNERYALGLEQRAVQRERPGDDDGSFVDAGFGIAVANLGSYPYADAEYHLPGDVPERIDYENVWMAVRAVLASALAIDEG